MLFRASSDSYMTIHSSRRPPYFVRSFQSFSSAASATFRALQEQTCLPTWLFARVVHDEFLVIASLDPTFNLRPGLAMKWGATIASRVIRGEVPQALPDISRTPSLREVGILREISIAAHVSVPIALTDGATGVLIGMSPIPRGADLVKQLKTVRTAASVLATLWEHEARTTQAVRRAERAELESMTDPMTGTYNRRGWKGLLKREDARCTRTQQTAGIIVLDLDYLKATNDVHGHGAGDDLIVRTSELIKQHIREQDALARMGGDEFAILLPDLRPSEVMQASLRLKNELSTANISATFGYSWRDASRSLAQAYVDADAVLIQAKALRRLRESDRGEPAEDGLIDR